MALSQLCVCVHMLDGADAPHRIGLGSFELEWCGSVCVCVCVCYVCCVSAMLCGSFVQCSLIRGTHCRDQTKFKQVNATRCVAAECIWAHVAGGAFLWLLRI